MKQDKMGFRWAIITLVWVSAPGTAFAYIDPGNGAYMVQALFTVIGAALFYLRHPVRSCRALLERLMGRWKRVETVERSMLPEERSMDE